MEFILTNPRGGKTILSASHNLSCLSSSFVSCHFNREDGNIPPFTAEENEGATS